MGGASPNSAVAGGVARAARVSGIGRSVGAGRGVGGVRSPTIRFRVGARVLGRMAVESGRRHAEAAAADVTGL